MTPLGAAMGLLRWEGRTYWESVPTGTVGRLGPDVGPVLMCSFCRRRVHEHASSCPMPAAAAIIAALEAADRLVELPPVETLVTDACVFCYAEGCKGLEVDEPEWTIDHAPDCRWRALTTALKGEQS